MDVLEREQILNVGLYKEKLCIDDVAVVKSLLDCRILRNEPSQKVCNDCQEVNAST